LNQYNTADHFYSKQNLSKNSIEDFKGEIISIRKKHSNEISTINKTYINNKQLSNFNNLKPLNNLSKNDNQNDYNNLNTKQNNPIDNLNQTKSYMSESNNNFSTKNPNKINNNNLNNNNLLSRSISTSHNFFGPLSKLNNIRNSKEDVEQTLYVTQSVRNNFQSIPDHLGLKYNITSKNARDSWNAINKIFNKRNQGFYCPHCEHCNKIQDENLEQYFAMKEAKNIIKKGFDYICDYYDNEQSFLDFLINMNQCLNSNSNTNVNNNLSMNNSDQNFIVNNIEKGLNKNFVNKIKNNKNVTNNDSANNSNGFIPENTSNNLNNNKNTDLFKNNKSPKKLLINAELENIHFPKGQNNQNYNMNIINGEMENIKNNKKSNKFDLDRLLLTYPKISTDRNVLHLVTNFLDALVNDKISLHSIVTPEIFDKLKERLIAQGLAFRANEKELDFDKEIDLLFDEATREKIKKLFKSKLFFLIFICKKINLILKNFLN